MSSTRSVNNGLGIPGLISGMDTQAMIDKIMKYDKMPLDSLKQKQQLLWWKQEAYRTQNTALSKLKDLVFNLKLEKNYNTKSVTSSNSQVVTATAMTGAANGSYRVRVTQLATVATNTSDAPVSIRSSVKGDYLDSITIDGTNNSFNISIDGVQQQITLQASDYATYTFDGSSGKDLDDLAQAIQTQLNAIGPVYVKATSDHQLQFYMAQQTNTDPIEGNPHEIVLNAVAGDSTLSNLKFAEDANSRELIGSSLNAPIIVSAAIQKFKITVGNGATHEITLSTGEYTDEQLANEINTQLHNIPALADVNVSVNYYHQLQITSTNGDSIKLESGSSNDVLWKMGFTSGVMSEYPKNTISTDVSFWNQQDKFIDSGFFSGKTASSTFNFSINGQSFTFSYNDTLDKVISDINSNTAAGVSVFFDDFSDKLILNTTKTGNNNPVGNEIQISDPNGFLGGLFNIDPSQEIGGQNAILTINGLETQRQSNTFTVNNVSFTLTGETGGGPDTVISVATDTANVVKTISEFVDQYNTVIAGINSKTSETKATYGNNYTYYLPLTDEQKKEMSDDEITTWNTKAQQGILRNDRILSETTDRLRSSLSRAVYTPRTITGIALSGTIDLTGSNHFSITVGSSTREISLTQASYDSADYGQLVQDIQQKLNYAFGSGRVKVAIDSNKSITLTSNNETVTLKNASQYNGLNLLGFSNGQNAQASFNMLSQIGITTSNDYKEYGKLNLDKDALTAALEKDPDGVMRLLTNNQTTTLPSDATPSEIANAKLLDQERQGMFAYLHDVLATQVTNITNQAGLFGTASYGNELGKQLIEIGDQIDTTQDRINSEEQRLLRQFNLMENALARMSSQMDWLSSMFGFSGNS